MNDDMSEQDPWAYAADQGIDHRTEALKSARKAEYDIGCVHEGPDTKEQLLQEAQVHATLALHHDLAAIVECLAAMVPA